MHISLILSGATSDVPGGIPRDSARIAVKLVNGETDEDVEVKSPYNLFVGGNKLGRGVTIKNLLVSYYGRNPRRPQADTVLQHARMYGYRRKDIGLLRLFLPRQLHIVFKAINKMEQGLRNLIATNPDEEFRGVYVESGLSATRKNILVPGAVGVYSAGSNYILCCGLFGALGIVRIYNLSKDDSQKRYDSSKEGWRALTIAIALIGGWLCGIYGTVLILSATQELASLNRSYENVRYNESIIADMTGDDSPSSCVLPELHGNLGAVPARSGPA
jgi:Z1 domain